MEAGLRSAESPFALCAAARDALDHNIAAAVRRARRDGRRVLASVSQPLDPEVDVSAAVLASRRGDDRAFCFEQPDRDRFALAALGQAAAVSVSGVGRFIEAAEACRALARDPLVTELSSDRSPIPAAAGPVLVGGFAFADDGGQTAEWSSLAPGQLTLPEVSLARG